jgi:hypothetical protein
MDTLKKRFAQAKSSMVASPFRIVCPHKMEESQVIEVFIAAQIVCAAGHFVKKSFSFFIPYALWTIWHINCIINLMR